MTNEQVFRLLPLKDIASIILRRKYVEDWDYDFDENLSFWGYKTYLVTSDGLKFDELDYKDALEHECWWLQQEAVAITETLQEE